MNFEDILWIALMFYLGWRLYEVLHVRPKGTPKLRLISQKTGQVIEVNLFDEEGKSLLQPVSPEETFIVQAKDLFSQIVHGFVTGEIEKLKTLVSRKVLLAFEQAIDQRRQKNQHMDFTLVDFKEVKLLKTDSDKVRRVAFTTEQINLMKDHTGQVISGDPMYVTTVKEIWTFEQQPDNTWILSATQKGGENVA